MGRLSVVLLPLPKVPFADAPVQEIGFPVVGVVLAWIPYHVRARALAAAHRAGPNLASGLLRGEAGGCC